MRDPGSALIRRRRGGRRFFRRIGDWFRYRLTENGKLLCITAVVAVMFGLDEAHAAAAFLGIACFALLAAAAIWSWRDRPNIEVTRHLPDCVTAGIGAKYSLLIANPGPRPIAGLLLRDCCISFRPETTGGDPVADAVGWKRFRLRRAPRREPGLIRLDPIALPVLRPGQSLTVSASFVPRHRGTVVFQSILVLRPDPLGLMYSRGRIDTVATAIVLPRMIPVPSLQLPSHRRYQAGGVSLAGTVADAREFAKLRDYRPGDPVKHIHWRSWARFDRPIVKEYQEEFFDRQALLVDTFLADRSPELLESVLSLAASFAAQPQRPDGLLDLLLIGSNAIHLTSGRGVADRISLLRALALTPARAASEFPLLTNLLRAELSNLSGVLCLLGSWDERRAELLGLLRAHGVRCRTLLVVTANDAQGSSIPAEAGTGSVLPLRVEHLAEDLRLVGAAS